MRDLAGEIDAIADRVSEGDTSWELHLAINSVSETLLSTGGLPSDEETISAVRLLNRIALLSIDPTVKSGRYDFTLRVIEKLRPLDRETDSTEVRRLAGRIRGAGA